jgi:uncharacterized membrane protein
MVLSLTSLTGIVVKTVRLYFFEREIIWIRFNGTKY